MNICYPSTTDWSCAGTPEEILELDPGMKARSEALAWLSVQRLTGYRLSLCPTVLRPCAKKCNPDIWIEAGVDGGFQPYISGGKWYNACGCGQRDSCGCGAINEIVLPVGSVGGPVVVRIGGATLNPSAYRVDNGNRLVRQDGQPWPLCQDMNLPDGAEGTFSVEYYPGVGPDSALSYAAGLLAVEFYKACSGNECALPSGVANVTRQGISFQIPAGIFEDGRSGIREVDLIISSYNPHRLVTPSRILSPDSRRGRIRTA